MISILITYFNEFELLKRCLESINKQTLLPQKVVVYDDKSTNKLLVSDLPTYNFPIEIVNAEKNRGPAYGRNYLMNNCESEYFRFQDADDELFEDAVFTIQKSITTNNHPQLVINEISSFNENGTLNTENVIGLASLKEDLVGFSISNVLLIPSVTYKTSFANSITGFKSREELAQSEDSDFIRRLSLNCTSFAIVHQSIAKQNLRLHSHSHSNQNDVWISGLKSLIEIKPFLDKKHKSAYANRILFIAKQLVSLKEFEHAKQAFKEFKKQEVAYSEKNKTKLLLIKLLGYYNAEKIALVLRKNND